MNQPKTEADVFTYALMFTGPQSERGKAEDELLRDIDAALVKYRQATDCQDKNDR